jgi:hypothetical protein
MYVAHMDFLFRALAPGLALVVLTVGFLVLAPVLLYIVARWRSEAPDPHLGLKFALHHFAFAAFQIVLVGVTLLIYMFISPATAEKGTAGYRAAVAFIIPGASLLAVHVVLLRRTNDEAMPLVRRLFWGYNLIITGLAAFGALLLGFQMLLAKGSTGGLGHLAGAMVVVYGTAWALLGLKFGQLVLGAAPAAHVEREAAAPVPHTLPASSSTSLPALGGGSYPPIEK